MRFDALQRAPPGFDTRPAASSRSRRQRRREVDLRAFVDREPRQRRGKNTQLPLADLLRQSVYSRIAGYGDVNNAGRLPQDPTFRLIGSEKI